MAGAEVDVGGIVDLNSHDSFTSDDLVSVETMDAIIALRLMGRNQSADWWRRWMDERQADSDSPTSGTRLIFRREEGEVLSREDVASIEGSRRYVYFDQDVQTLLYVYYALGRVPVSQLD